MVMTDHNCRPDAEIIPEPIGNIPAHEALDLDAVIQSRDCIVPIGDLCLVARRKHLELSKLVPDQFAINLNLMLIDVPACHIEEPEIGGGKQQRQCCADHIDLYGKRKALFLVLKSFHGSSLSLNRVE